MKTLRAILLVSCFSLAGNCYAQTAAPHMRHLLVLAEEKGYRHEAVSHAAATIERLGREAGLWTTTIRTDTEALTKQKLEYNAKNLNDFDAVLFYTAGDLEAKNNFVFDVTTHRNKLNPSQNKLVANAILWLGTKG